jgi:hypothetical protein
MPAFQAEKAKAELAAKADWDLTEHERLELIFGVTTIPTKTKMIFAEEPIAPAGSEPRKDGRHLVREEPDGIKVYAEVEDGRITKYSAERDGAELEFIHPDVDRHEDEQVLWRCFRTQEHWVCYRHRM